MRLYPEIVAALRADAVRAAAKNARTFDQRMRRATRWLARRDSYDDAVRALREGDPMRLRSEKLSEHAAWRALAWVMIAEHDLGRAIDARRQAAAVWREIKQRAKA